MLKKIQILFILFYAVNIGVKAQVKFSGMPFITHFTSADYNGGIQNWDIKQDNRGFIYVANNFGLLEYDGNDWRLYTFNNNTRLRSIYIADDNRIYVGGQSQIGYLSANEQGKLIYHSLNPLIPKNKQSFDDVWTIYESKEAIVFGTNRFLFLYKDNKISTIGTPEQFSHPTPQNFPIDFQEVEETPVFEANSIHQIELFDGYSIRGILPYNDKKLVATFRNGLFTIDNNKAIPWNTAVNDVFKETFINKIIPLSNKSFAIGTQNDGVFIISQKGEIINHFTIDKGLNNRTINCLYEDHFQNLWVGMNDGLSYIELGSPFTHINEYLGLQGIGYKAACYDNKIYLGTSNGLFYQAGNDHFKLVENTEGHVNYIEKLDDMLLLSHHEGPFIVKEKVAQRLNDSYGSWKFIQDKQNPDYFIEGHYDGLRLYQKKKGTLQFVMDYQQPYESSRVLAQENNGTIWMTHGYKGAYKIVKEGNELISVDHYNRLDGFPSDILINVFPYKEDLIFGSANGIYEYVPSLDSFVVFNELNEVLETENYIGQFEQDQLGNIYFIADNKVGMLMKNIDGSYIKEKNLFNKVNYLLNDDLLNITCLDIENVIIGAKTGFIHFNPTVSKTLPEKFYTYLRSVSSSGMKDTSLYSGSTMGIQEITPTLLFENNNVTFTYASPFYDGLGNEFSYRLKGFDTDWSNWSFTNSKEYTNLYEGNYTFEVRSRNIYGRVSEVASFKFDILPPWYRSITAYAIYIIATLGLFGVALIILDRKHKKDKVLMEEKQQVQLKEKDFKLDEISKKSEQEITQLKNDKLKSEIKHKNKELASATMYIINKNEFINEIKHGLNSIIKRKNGVSTELSKIVKDINKNMNEPDDWKQFEVHFDEVHQGFTTKLKDDFPNLTPQEIKLSAYLRMNMTTKEMASLMHISPRGVEIGRYRLRKKLGLERSTNLVDFMMNY